MVEQVHPSMGGAAQKMREGAEEFKEAVTEKATETAKRASARMGAYAEQASETVAEYAEEATSFIKDRPITSILAAFGVGLAVGMLLLRRAGK